MSEDQAAFTGNEPPPGGHVARVLGEKPNAIDGDDFEEIAANSSVDFQLGAENGQPITLGTLYANLEEECQAKNPDSIQNEALDIQPPSQYTILCGLLEDLRVLIDLSQGTNNPLINNSQRYDNCRESVISRLKNVKVGDGCVSEETANEMMECLDGAFKQYKAGQFAEHYSGELKQTGMGGVAG